jgi:hypothetical protein
VTITPQTQFGTGRSPLCQAHLRHSLPDK